MPSTSPPPAPKPSKPPSGARNALASTLAGLTGFACVLGVFLLIGVGRLEPGEGLPWIIATLSGLGVVQVHNGRR